MKLFIFLDYDGTLTPIVSRPEKAVLKPEMKGLLRWLSKKKGVRLAVVSGRALADVKSRVGLRNIIYAGNHGMEIEGAGLKFKLPVPEGQRRTLKRAHAVAKKIFRGMKGVIIEYKGFTLSIHYRMAAPGSAEYIKSQVRAVFGKYAGEKLLRIDTGKKVFEIKPFVKWDKGKAILWLLGKYGAGRCVLPVYIGDDRTDEDAFDALKGRGITIKVGKPSGTKAMYSLPDVDSVRDYISQVARMDI